MPEPSRLHVRGAYLNASTRQYFANLASQVNWRLIGEASDKQACLVAQILMSAVDCATIKLVNAHKCGAHTCVTLEFAFSGKTSIATYYGEVSDFHNFLSVLRAVAVS